MGAKEMISSRPDSCGTSQVVRRGRWYAATLVVLVGQGVGAQEAVTVHTPHVEIDYAVNRDAYPIEDVEVWYTEDQGATWRLFGHDDDLRSPAVFTAPGEGLFGVFVIVRNATGPSSQPPTSATAAHRWIFVDSTPPVVQLHALRETTFQGERVILIRWTAIDTLLPQRPIELQYQTQAGPDWHAITPEPLPNTGQYDWQVPAGVTTVALRAVVQDRGGHRTVSEPRTISLMPPAVQPTTPVLVSSPPPRVASEVNGSPRGLPIDRPADETRVADHQDDDGLQLTALTGSPRAKDLAERLFSEALTLREQGDLPRGVSRLREAVRLDPTRMDAFAEMAGMLYGLGDLDRAMGAYEIVLRQEPTSRSALLGSAAVLSQRREYAAAAQRLRTILRYRPNDAEVWMSLGDIAVYQGDEPLARECYTRASQIDPSAERIVTDARARLQLMSEVSRTYRSGG